MSYYEGVEVDNKNIVSGYLTSSLKSFFNLTGRIFKPSNLGINFSGSKYPDSEPHGHASG